MNKRFLQAVTLIAAIIILVILAKPNAYSMIVGGILVLIGEATRVWASGHLIRNNEVTTSGPYSYVRDPLYIGRLLLLIGFCVMGWGYNWIILIIGLFVFFLNYMPRKYRKEMAGLENLFGEEYTRYAAYTHSMIPRLKPYPHARQRPWSFSLFLKENREHYFLLGVVVLWAILISRYYNQ